MSWGQARQPVAHQYRRDVDNPGSERRRWEAWCGAVLLGDPPNEADCTICHGAQMRHNRAHAAIASAREALEAAEVVPVTLAERVL